MLRKLIVVAFLICCTMVAVAQTKPRLAILPITGGSGDDGETIAELFSFEPEIDRVFIRIPRTSSIDSIMREQQFQSSTGLTDSDTIARLGKQLNADYVVAGHIHTLGESKLIIITIIHVESLQQIAGDYKEYKTIEEIQGMIPDMARRITRAAQIRRANLPKLAVLPFATPASGVDQSDAEVLAQLLATDIANSGKYIVLPRTSQIQAVMREHEIQRSDLTEASNIKAIGEALNAQYVLAGNVRRLGEANIFTAQILEAENGSILPGGNGAENYNTIEDGLTAMAKLSGKLTGVTTPAPAITTAPRIENTPSSNTNTGSSGSRKKSEPNYGLMNIAFGLGSYTQGDRTGGIIITSGYVLSIGLIIWELAGLTYDDALAGVPGTIGLGLAGATLVYGFIRPAIYSKNQGFAAILDKANIAVVSDEQRGNGMGVRITYTHSF